ncbi:methionine synthase [Luteococcus sp. H138]|uniref:methionine synthase n=1 Tax=unclassified Luteococcus TaxID=2639923 RepID=UPI00313DA4F2
MSENLRMPGTIRATGIGSLPGQDLPGAVRHVLGAFELAWLPELPGRGVGADLIGRSLAMTDGLAFDLQPQGWRLADHSGVDHARARALLRRDLDDLEEAAQGFSGQVTLTVAGPWTLAASLERPRAERVLADHGARRELAESLASGVTALIGELGRRLPEVDWRIQLDEPLLPSVMGAKIPTASGLATLRGVDRPLASELLGRIARPLGELTGPVRLHCCAPGLDLELMGRSGIDELALDVGTLSARELDAVGEWLEAGRRLVLGLAPTDVPDALSTPDRIVRRGLDLLRPLGLDPALLLSGVDISPACGLAGWSLRPAITQLDALLEAAPLLAEQIAR